MNICERFSKLPVNGIVDEVNASLSRHPRLVVTAPPGAGKSTLLPLTFLDSIPNGKILMLEPRRIAARQVAERMAAMLGENTGQTIGYRVRFDSRVSAMTRIEVITEGILERMLIDNPTLDGISAVIFDEFHERSLSSDLTLALTREIQDIIRPDLRIIVMSATIDAESLTRKIDAIHIHCPGNNFDVKIVYGEDFDFPDCASVVARTVRKAMRKHDGNILAFLPGQAEILKCLDMLSNSTENADIMTLYGMMPYDQQQQVLTPIEGGRRKIVLSSPIAETSLTIEGISVVVDSGLYRVPVFESSTGLSRLTTARISMDMAVQRTGRAGRLMEGVCYRLWTKATESRMKENRIPEIESADLSSMVLMTAACGETNPQSLPWVTPPPSGHVASAVNLLRMLGAIDNDNRLTEKGKRIAPLPCHPRIASMLTEAGEMKSLACDIAALMEEKDPLCDESDADITTRISILRQIRKGKLPPQWKRIDNISIIYRKLVKATNCSDQSIFENIGRLVALAYPERIAMRDDRGHYRLSAGGNSVTLHPKDDLARHEFLAIVSTGSRIFLAAPIDKNFVMSQGKWIECAIWNSREGRVIAHDELRLGQLILATRQSNGDTRSMITDAIAEAAPKDGLTMFDFNEDVKWLQLRIAVAASWHPELDLPDISTETILATTGHWLPLYIGHATTVQELRKIDIRSVILGMLSYEQQKALDSIVPTHIKLPSGRNIRIQYRRGTESPVVSARLQDCFGLMDTPKVDEGRRQVLMELLSPGFKPVQLTQDMKGFWENTYFDVRKELRRRYPKHRWPEDPYNYDKC